MVIYMYEYIITKTITLEIIDSYKLSSDFHECTIFTCTFPSLINKKKKEKNYKKETNLSLPIMDQEDLCISPPFFEDFNCSTSGF